MSADESIVAELRAAGVPRALSPADRGAALEGFDSSVDYRPTAVVRASSPLDVARAMGVAASQGAAVVAFGTGHGMPARVDAGVIIATRDLASVTVDVRARTATVGAGATWQDVLSATAGTGLAPTCGSAPGVGVVGLLLGGGIGPLVRQFGACADAVRSLHIVTPAEGSVVASPTDDAELFWAARGGKWGLGVVTSVTIELVPQDRLVGGGLFFGAGDIESVARTVIPWAEGLDSATSVSLALLAMPDSPHVPAPLRNRLVAHLRYASVSDIDRAQRELAPVRAAGSVLLDTVTTIAYEQIGSIHADPITPQPVMSLGAGLGKLDSTAIDALLQVAGPGRDPGITIVELRLLGGALRTEQAEPSAMSGRSAQWNLFVSSRGADSAIRAVADAMEPWRADEALINFFGHANTTDELMRVWSPDQRNRLSAIRERVDTHGLLQSSQP